MAFTYPTTTLVGRVLRKPTGDLPPEERRRSPPTFLPIQPSRTLPTHTNPPHQVRLPQLLRLRQPCPPRPPSPSFSTRTQASLSDLPPLQPLHLPQVTKPLQARPLMGAKSLHVLYLECKPLKSPPSVLPGEPCQGQASMPHHPTTTPRPSTPPLLIPMPSQGTNSSSRPFYNNSHLEHPVLPLSAPRLANRAAPHHSMYASRRRRKH